MSSETSFAARVAGPVGALGGAWFISPQAKAAAKILGVSGWPAYVRGRASAMGDVDAAVVASVFGFFPAELVEQWWAEPCELDAAEVFDVYLEACRGWSREHLDGMPDTERLVELLGRVERAADGTGAPLFAAWRKAPLPDDAPGAAGQLLMRLRELRGGQHVMAVVACGLTPAEAMVSAPGGRAHAQFFGWEPQMLPEPNSLMARTRLRAELLTDAINEQAWSALDEGEQDDVVRLLADAMTTAGLG